MKTHSILVVEDDPNLGTILAEYLRAKQYQVKLVSDGQQGIESFVKHDYDLLLLDVMMPVKDGFTMAQEVRKLNRDVPIIFLTAKSMKEDTIEGFKIGADDYVTKPFSMEELLLRINAILRRTSSADVEGEKLKNYRIGKFEFNPHLRQLTMDGQEAQRLTSKENQLLKLLCMNKNDVLEREYALKAIWGDDSYFNSRSMDVYITKIRKHLKADDQVEVVNVHGRGFKLLEMK